MPDLPTERENTLAEHALADLHQAIDGLPACRIFVLIDPALADPLADGVLPADMTAKEHRPRLTLDIIRRDQQPYLVELPTGISGERLLSETLHVAIRERFGAYDRSAEEDGEPAEVRSVCAWLLAETGGEDFMRQLAYRLSQCWVRSPFDRERIAFRYWDPRLTPHLPRILGADAWAERLAAFGLRAWSCLDDDSRPHRFAAAAAAPADAMPPWDLDRDRWLALARIHWTKRACQLLPQWEDVPAGIGRDTVRAVVERTAGYGLRDEADVLRFVHSALALHPRFDSHPQVAAALADLKAQGSPPGGFAHVAQRWTDDFRNVLHEGRWLQDVADARREQEPR